jgi:hypothetical protein
MSKILEYAGSHTPRRSRWRWILLLDIDLDLLAVSLLQTGIWVLLFCRGVYHRPVVGNQTSLYALAWRLTQDNYLVAMAGLLSSVLLCIGTVFRASKRFWWYWGYLALFATTFGPTSIAYDYLKSQLPGVWGSLVGDNRYENDGVPMFYIFQPLVWVLIVRLFEPGVRFIGGPSVSQTNEATPVLSSE